MRTADWLGPLERVSREDGLAELARRFLRGYAPADERDLARWSGLALRDARLGFERIAAELDEVEVEGKRLAVLSKERPRPPRSPAVRMLGAFDNYDLGYVDRTVALDAPHEKQVNPGGGIIRPAIVVDGRYVATWTSKRSGKRLAVTIEPFESSRPSRRRSSVRSPISVGSRVCLRPSPAPSPRGPCRAGSCARPRSPTVATCPPARP